MVQREIPRDAKEPGAPAPFIGLRYRRARHSQKHLLRQLARVFAADDSAQIAKDAFPVRGEEDVSVSHEGAMSTIQQRHPRSEILSGGV